LNLYLDADVLVPLFRDELATPSIQRLVRGSDQVLFVSNFAAGEVGSAFARLARMKLLTDDDALQRLAAFDHWRAVATNKIACDDFDIGNAALLVRRFDLAVRLPDAVHLAICVRHTLALATLDRQLADAAKSIGSQVVVPA